MVQHVNIYFCLGGGLRNSGGTSPHYQNGHGEAVPVGAGFIGPRTIGEQTEPVDFSTANEPVNFSGVRPVSTFAGPVLTTGTGYSRESTPDSGGSHYMDAYRDNSGKNNLISRFTYHSLHITQISDFVCLITFPTIILNKLTLIKSLLCALCVHLQ